jgi:hypothetical protein
LTIALTGGLPTINASGVSIISGTGTVVDGSAIASANCLDIAADNIRVEGLTLRNCLGTAVNMTGNNNQVVRCQFLQNRRVLLVYGGSNLLVADNLFAQNLSYAIQTEAPAQIIRNVIRDNAEDGVRLLDGATGTLVAQNVFRRNLSAVGVLGQATGSRIVHNVIDGHAEFSVLVGSRANAIELKNNIFTANRASSVINDGGDNAVIQYNDLFGNLGGACTCGALDSTNQAYDPRYANSTAEDMRLSSDSPLINAGIDTGVDVNGPFAGNFNGSAPDIGAYEAP